MYRLCRFHPMPLPFLHLSSSDHKMLVFFLTSREYFLSKTDIITSLAKNIHNLLEISLSPSVPPSLRIIPTKYATCVRRVERSRCLNHVLFLLHNFRYNTFLSVMHTSEYDFLFKLLLIGDSSVGKVKCRMFYFQQ